MVIAGWFSLGFAVVCLGFGVVVFCYMIHLGKMWLKDQEPSSELKAINELTVITREIAKKLGVNVLNNSEDIGTVNTQICKELRRIKNKGQKK